MKLNRMFVMIGAIVIVSCTKNGENSAINEQKHNNVVTEGNVVEHEFTRGDAVHLEVSLSEQEERIFESGYSFATDLFEKVATNTGNVCISPLSIQTLLCILSNGLKDDLASKMIGIMFGQDAVIRDINSGYGKLRESLEATNCVKLSNAIWLQDGNNFNRAFLATGRDIYHSTTKNLDFNSAPQSAMDSICQWAYDNSYGRLTKLGLEKLGSNTVMALGNIVCFSSSWMSAFDTTKTTVGEFLLDDGIVMDVDMMFRAGYMDYKILDKYGIISLPFENKSFRMDLFVPNDGYNINELIPEIDWSVKLEMGKVNLQMPKFTVHSNVDGRYLLEQTGMSELFHVGVFDRMTDQDNDAHIDELKQDILIKVDEGGVEAAAASVASYVSRTETVDFRIDRPFVFAIRDNAIGSFLFMGKVSTIDIQ